MKKNHAMKKIFFLVLVTLSYALFSQKRISFPNDQHGMKITENQGTSFTASFAIRSIEFQQVITPLGPFADLRADNFTYNIDPGNPHTPVYARLIEMPGQVPVKITVKNFSTTEIPLREYGIMDKLIPSQPSYFKNTNPEDIIFHMNETAYLSDTYPDKELVTVHYEGMSRGTGVAQLIIDPFRYNPVQNTLLVYTNIEFEVVFETEHYHDYLAEKERVYSPVFETLYQSLANFTPPATRDVITKYPIKYVIVSHPTFKDSLQQFIQWKRQKGFTVIEAYTNQPNVGNTTTSIKNYLQGLYNAGTPTDPAPSFVLLVGDVGQIPAFSGTTGSHPTDMYYVEYTGGTDYIPEVYIGRFSATNLTELMPQIYKTLQYEKFTMPSAAYMDTCVLVAGYDANGYDASHGNPQINYATNNYFNASHGIYAWTVLDPQNTEAIAGNFMRDKLYKGFGVANYTAHCDWDRWGEPSFTTTHVNNMQNKDKYGLMIGNCCLSNKFNATGGPCLGEKVLQTANKGAIGYIGGSNNTLWNEDYWWSIGTTSSIQSNPTYTSTGLGAYDRLFHTNNEPYSDWFITNGQIVYAGNLAVQASTSSQKKYYWEIYHLMGDPSVMTYLSAPDPLNISYNQPLIVGDDSLVVQCEPHTLVALSMNDTLLDSKYSMGNSQVTLKFQPLTQVGFALIVATKQNKIPYIQNIPVEDIQFAYDAQMISISNLQSHYNCTNVQVEPIITIRNRGTSTLTQLQVHYKWNNSPEQTLQWTGSLASMQTTTIQLPAYVLQSGTQILTVYTSNPNGQPDQNPDNDTLTFQLVAQNLPVVAEFSAPVTQFCMAPATVQFVNNSENAQSYTWYFGDGNSSNQTSPVHTYTSPGQYTVTLVADAGICGQDVFEITNFITIGTEPPVVNNAAHCGAGSLQLVAQSTFDVYWYADPQCQNLLHTGSTFTTPLLTQTTAYYARTEMSNTYYGGKEDNSGVGGYFTYAIAHGLIFDCTAPVLLKSVKVYFGGTTPANRTIRLENSQGNLLQDRTVTIQPGESRIELNMPIPVGTNLRLMGPTSPNLYRNGSMTLQYPYQVGNYISIVRSTAASGNEYNYYYYFYDWEVIEHCVSAPVEATAYIDSIPVSSFVFSADDLTVNFTNLSTGGSNLSYLWNFGDGQTSTQKDPVHTYQFPGTYTVTLEAINSCGSDVSEQQVSITTDILTIEQYGIILYPNPVHNLLYIQSPQQIDKVRVFDVNGRLMYEAEPQSNRTVMTTEFWAPGIYTIILNTKTESIIQRIVKK